MSRFRPSKTVSALGEDRLVVLLTRRLPQSERTICGPGDDCAVLAGRRGYYQLFKTDCLIEGVHFNANTDPSRAGWKALCRCVSDVAAMGGVPQEALVTLAMPPSTPVSWVQDFYRGLTRAARQWETGIAGGETSSVPAGAPIMISVAMLGEVERTRLVLRSGAKPDDVICVSGFHGGSRSGWHLDFTPRLREARWLVGHCKPTAMMDLSDGLAKDLPRLADASNVGFYVNPSALPRRGRSTVAQAAGDGEDYELLFTVPPEHAAKLLRGWTSAFPDVNLKVIGEILRDKRDRTPMRGGWEHFPA